MSRIVCLLVAGTAMAVLGCAQESPTEPAAPAGSSLAAAQAAPVARPAGGSCTTRLEFPAPEEGQPANVQRITFEADCILKHLGKATATFSETVTFTGPNTATFVSSDMIYVAANGDELHARMDDGAVVLDAQGGATLTVTEVYTGGTGRFADAAGFGAITGQASVVTQTGAYEIAGSITY
jgi:hypothetical protein